MSNSVVGILALSEDVACKKEVLGKSFPALIGGINACLLFPEYNEANNDVGDRNPLLPPRVFSSWKRRGDPCFWGFVCNQPSGNSIINVIALSIDCDTDGIDECSQRIYKAKTKWEHAFVDYLKLETKQNIYRDKNNTRNPGMLRLYASGKEIQDMQPYHIYLSPIYEESAASIDSILEALSFANSGKELLLEYRMLLSAYEARQKNRNRQAIIDASAAAEICIVRNIKKHFSASGLNGEFFLKKYKSLGDRFGLMHQFDGSFLDTEYQNKIVRPRNDVVHSNTQIPSDETTDELIQATEDCLKYFFDGYSER